jgi:toxin ParE1/3/4
VLDLVECAAFLAEDNIEASERFLDAAERAFRRLSVMPRIGRPWVSGVGALAGVRKWPIPRFRNYLVFYRPLSGGIEVLRVLHATREIFVILDD